MFDVVKFDLTNVRRYKHSTKQTFDVVVKFDLTNVRRCKIQLFLLHFLFQFTITHWYTLSVLTVAQFISPKSVNLLEHFNFRWPKSRTFNKFKTFLNNRCKLSVVTWRVDLWKLIESNETFPTCCDLIATKMHRDPKYRERMFQNCVVKTSLSFSAGELLS